MAAGARRPISPLNGPKTQIPAETALAPILVFAYDRPWHLQQTIEALKRGALAPHSDLFVVSDGARGLKDAGRVDRVRQYLRTLGGFQSVTVIPRTQNFGLAASIVAGVTEVVERFGRVIVVEDDLVTSPYFLEYMNGALRLYENAEQVISLTGYVYPTGGILPETFFIRGADCLGWATWKRGWDLFENDATALLDQLKRTGQTRAFDLNGACRFTRMLAAQRVQATSWAVKWYASAFLKNRLTLYPGRSLVRHIGNDHSGTNFGDASFLDVELTATPIELGGIDIAENVNAARVFAEYLRSVKTPLWRGIANWIRRTCKSGLSLTARSEAR